MSEKICSKQFYKIVIVYIIANDIVRGIYAQDIYHDVWIPNLIGIFMSILLYILYMFIYKNTKFNNFDNSMKHILGKIFSKILYIFYIVYFLLLIYFNLTDVQEIVSLSLIPGYSHIVINLIILITIAYVASKGIEVLARLSELLFFGILAIFIAMIVLTTSIHDIQLDNILPILKDGIKPIILPAIEMSCGVPYGELFVILIVFQHLKDNDKYTKVGIYSILTSGFILTTVTLFNIVIIGPYSMSYGLSPAFRLARMIDIEEYVQRLDLLLIGFHMILVLVKIIILLFGVGCMLESIFNLKAKQVKITYYISLALVLISTLIFGRSYTSILLFRFEFFMLYISPIMEILLPILIVLVSFARKSKLILKPNEVMEFQI